MSFYRPTRLELSMHEAGHAYAFAAVTHRGVPHQMGLGTDENGDHHGWCSRDTLLHKVTLARVTLDILPHIEWAAAAEIIVAISGSTAEFRHRHRNWLSVNLILHDNAELFLKPATFDTDGDFERIRSTFAYARSADPVAELRRLMSISKDVVAANWPNVVRLGRHLLANDRLGEDELFRWFQAHPVRRPRSDVAITLQLSG